MLWISEQVKKKKKITILSLSDSDYGHILSAVICKQNIHIRTLL